MPFFLCNKELYKKSALILIFCQRWGPSEKTKTSITFDLNVILTSGLFWKSYFLKVFQLKKQNYMRFVKCSTAFTKSLYLFFINSFKFLKPQSIQQEWILISPSILRFILISLFFVNFEHIIQWRSILYC